jgi:hypothetical protein
MDADRTSGLRMEATRASGSPNAERRKPGGLWWTSVGPVFVIQAERVGVRR